MGLATDQVERREERRRKTNLTYPNHPLPLWPNRSKTSVRAVSCLTDRSNDCQATHYAFEY